MHCPAVQGRDGEHEKDPNEILEMAKNLMFGLKSLSPPSLATDQYMTTCNLCLTYALRLQPHACNKYDPNYIRAVNKSNQPIKLHKKTVKNFKHALFLSVN